jgi:hypothetical protein
MVNKISDILLYENSVPVEFIIRQNVVELIKEAAQETGTASSIPTEYIPKPTDAGIPRFSIKGIEGIDDVPINKPLPATEALLIKAIKYGMIFLVTYKGAKDNHSAGHERVIYPMVLGRSSVGKILLRTYHLKGWSVSNNRSIDKIWRMFRIDRIKSMIFTGSFYRLPPAGYNMHDKGMRGGILARANFNEIRTNQQSLLKTKEIQNRKDIELDNEGNEFTKIRVKVTDTKLDILNPYENPYVEDQKNAANLRITFLKAIFGDTYYAVLGALGRPGNTVKITDEKDKNLGTFKILDSIGGDVLKNIKKVKGNSVFDLYIFDKKL